ncbi:NAD(P)+ transhydrogenase beta chain [Rhizobium chutanense]|uniref:NAD(P)+ transhydrogenase beta chain n=1 Tax=Rhizobium chutanense TaxID=2035448 RepID=A0A2A6JHJ7_9HYPH|nr:NAD(P)+ transhydrogenase beta chain [Rhizobium chutanense]PDT05721.1 NAD(P)+ transhydrogenase beta chain [Rhizobium chutanense]
MQKPAYSTSKRSLWLNSFMAWLVILILAVGSIMQGQALGFATVAVPSLVLLIAGTLGIHRHYGSRDMELMQRDQRPEDSQ